MALVESDKLGAVDGKTAARLRSVASPTGLAVIWRDRSGRFSGLRLATFLLALAPGLWLGAALAIGAVGARPIETALDVTGVWAVRFLVLSLCATPFCRIFGWTQVMRVRRMLGLTAATYAGLHLCLFIVHQNFDLLRVASEIALRFYLTIGFVALAGLAALSVTSTDRWIKKLGPRWHRLHGLVYPIAGLALLHFLLQSKFEVEQAVFYVGLFGLLMAYRALPRRSMAQSPLILALCALIAVPLVMVFELGWHAAVTSVPLERIWSANFDFSGALRPAWEVGLAGAAVAVAALAHGFFKRRRGKT